jgi:propionyl-CoA synthetase
MRQIADGEPYKMPPTIDDAATLDEVRTALERLGYARTTAGVIAG